MVHLFFIALLTGITDSNLSLQQTGKSFTAMLSFLPLFYFDTLSSLSPVCAATIIKNDSIV